MGACAGLVAREDGRDHDLSLVVIVHLSCMPCYGVLPKLCSACAVACCQSSAKGVQSQSLIRADLEAALCKADVSSPENVF